MDTLADELLSQCDLEAPFWIHTKISPHFCDVFHLFPANAKDCTVNGGLWFRSSYSVGWKFTAHKRRQKKTNKKKKHVTCSCAEINNKQKMENMKTMSHLSTMQHVGSRNGTNISRFIHPSIHPFSRSFIRPPHMAPFNAIEQWLYGALCQETWNYFYCQFALVTLWGKLNATTFFLIMNISAKL